MVVVFPGIIHEGDACINGFMSDAYAFFHALCLT
jgi:hypothetical protein